MKFNRRVACFLGCSGSQNTQNSLLRATFLFYDESLLGALALYARAPIGRIYGARLAQGSTNVLDNTQAQLCHEDFFCSLNGTSRHIHKRRYSYKKEYDCLRDVGS